MMRFLPVNHGALMVELDDLAQTLALLASLRTQPIPGAEELVPAARTLLIAFRPAACTMESLVQEIADRDVTARAARDGTLVRIPVHYDGEDIAEVAALMGIAPQELVRRHTASVYSVAFTGFAPGFAYLTGGDPSFDNTPRRKTPRTRIPAGAVGLAGSFSGVYPQASPGGWQIIGTTPVAMWDIARAVPALLQPGFRVQFVDIATLPAAERAQWAVPAAASADTTPAAAQADTPALDVIAPGLQTLFQDRGRHGQAGQGVSASGAMDQTALKSANRLVGNASDRACLETVNGGLQLRSRGETVVAVTGADAPLSITDATGRRWAAARYRPIALADGDTITIGEPQAGMRCYLAARGGFDVAPVLGSCATDTLARVGPPALAAGDVLPLHPVAHGAVVGAEEVPPADLPLPGAVVELDIVLGPRTDWFTPAAVELLCRQEWTVTPQSNRVGIRLAGDTPLERAVTRELPSEGTALGAIQVPPSGQPVLFLADHPLTGGYPVIGAVAPYHLDRAGQIPVNARVRFRALGAFAPTTSTSAAPPTA